MEHKGSLPWFFSLLLCKQQCFVVKSQEYVITTLSVKICMAFIKVCRSQKSAVDSDSESATDRAGEIDVGLFFSF
jgi:hypothetical protein